MPASNIFLFEAIFRCLHGLPYLLLPTSMANLLFHENGGQVVIPLMMFIGASEIGTTLALLHANNGIITHRIWAFNNLLLAVIVAWMNFSGTLKNTSVLAHLSPIILAVAFTAFGVVHVKTAFRQHVHALQ